MLDPNFISNCKIVGKRDFDDVPCHECDEYGPIIIVEFEQRMIDLCHSCAAKTGIIY